MLRHFVFAFAVVAVVIETLSAQGPVLGIPPAPVLSLQEYVNGAYRNVEQPTSYLQGRLVAARFQADVGTWVLLYAHFSVDDVDETPRAARALRGLYAEIRPAAVTASSALATAVAPYVEPRCLPDVQSGPALLVDLDAVMADLVDCAVATSGAALVDQDMIKAYARCATAGAVGDVMTYDFEPAWAAWGQGGNGTFARRDGTSTASRWAAGVFGGGFPSSCLELSALSWALADQQFTRSFGEAYSENEQFRGSIRGALAKACGQITFQAVAVRSAEGRSALAAPAANAAELRGLDGVRLYPVRRPDVRFSAPVLISVRLGPSPLTGPLGVTLIPAPPVAGLPPQSIHVGLRAGTVEFDLPAPDGVADGYTAFLPLLGGGFASCPLSWVVVPPMTTPNWSGAVPGNAIAGVAYVFDDSSALVVPPPVYASAGGFLFYPAGVLVAPPLP